MKKIYTMKKMITHVLFDFDGTLVNTIDTMIKGVEEIIKKNGRELTKEIQDYIPNTNSFEVLTKFINEKANLQLKPQEFQLEISEYMYSSDVKLMPGVEKVLQYFYDQKIPMAIASGSSKKMLDGIISKFGDFFPKYFSHYVSAFSDPEVANRKPSPDVFLIAAKRFKSPPENMKQVLIFEDSITGLKAAVASGGKTIFVGDFEKVQNENEELFKNVTLKLKSLEEFDPSKLDLPSF